MIGLRDIYVPSKKFCSFNFYIISSFISSFNDVAKNGNIKSENNDGYSISYISTSEISDIVKSRNDELNDIIKTYLLGVIINDEHIMFVGV